MSEKPTNKTNNDILSGSGLRPITSTTQSTQSSGITWENRGINRNGLRLDVFGRNTNSFKERNNK